MPTERAVSWHKKRYRGFSLLHLADDKDYPEVSVTRCGRVVPDATEYTIWLGEEAWKATPRLCSICRPEQSHTEEGTRGYGSRKR